MVPFIIGGVLTVAGLYAYFGENLISSHEAKRLIKEGKIKKDEDKYSRVIIKK